MRGKTPTIHCHAEDGFCGSWDVDYYEMTASAVGATRITSTERSPGWFSVPCRDEDFCPKHAAEHPDNPKRPTPTEEADHG